MDAPVSTTVLRTGGLTRPLYAPASDTPQAYVRAPAGTHPPLDHPPYKSTALRHPRQPLVYVPQRLGRSGNNIPGVYMNTRQPLSQ